MANVEIDLAVLHTKIAEKINAKFGGTVKTIAAYSRYMDKLEVPAITFELDSIEASNPSDVGTQQLQVDLRFSASLIYSYKAGNKFAVRLMSGNFAAFLQGQRFGMPVTPARFIAATPQEFDAENPEYETWRIEWEHTCLLGATAWPEGGALPTDIRASWSPEIGIPHEPKYKPIQDLLAP